MPSPPHPRLRNRHSLPRAVSNTADPLDSAVRELWTAVSCDPLEYRHVVPTTDPFSRFSRVENRPSVIWTLHDFSLHNHFMGSARFLPLQVAAVCYRRCGASFDFLLVKTTSGDRWTFPKGATARRLSHSQAAEREALDEAGAVGLIEPQHFHLYLQPKGDSRLRNGVQESVVKAFILEVTHTQPPQEPKRNPTWFSADDARSALARGREKRHAAELRTVIDRAVERLSTEGRIVRRYRPSLSFRVWRSLLTALGIRPR